MRGCGAEFYFFFFFIDTATTEIYTLSLHDALPISPGRKLIRSYRVAAIAEIPPALVDESDHPEGSVLPPDATRQEPAEFFYAWIGLRLTRGTAGVPALQAELGALAR